MPVRPLVNGVDFGERVRQLAEQVPEVSRVPFIDHHPLAQPPHVLSYQALSDANSLKQRPRTTYLAFEKEELVTHYRNGIEVPLAYVRDRRRLLGDRCVLLAPVIVHRLVIAVIVDCPLRGRRDVLLPVVPIGSVPGFSVR